VGKFLCPPLGQSAPKLFVANHKTGLQMNITSLIRSALPLSVLLLAGCGGGGGSTTTPASTATGAHSVVYAVNKSAPVSNCPSGGITVQSGIDTNGNGVLDPSEVTSTQYVCNGTSGTAALVATTIEPAGANCASGGEMVSAGLDTNGNSILDASEVTTTAYVCNGTNGTNGLNTLVAIVTEPAGANCTYGGINVTSGLDTNANGTLDPSEVTTTKYVCNGPGINWVDVTGTSVQAVSNTGYSADSASRVTITLPVLHAMDDIIQVSGIGAGGWAIAQVAGQTIIIDGIAGIGGTNSAVISGSQYAAIELQYIGNNTFIVLNHTGNVGAVLSGGFVYQGGLIWTPVTTSIYNQPDAATLCTNTANGLDWRLPTQVELLDLYSLYPYSNGISTLQRQGWALSGTWSSTPDITGNHYNVYLDYGYVGSSNDLAISYATCVRHN
jgi:hypothetical protein